VSSPFDVKPAVNTAFAPRKGYMNKREQFIEYVFSNGWTLDPTATITTWRNRETKQNPVAFVRTSPTGEDWHLILGYPVDGNPNDRADNTLRGLTLWRQVGDRKDRYRLEAPGSYGSSRLWDVTGEGLAPGWREKALRPRAERLVADPDLSVWLYAEQRWIDDEAHRVATAKREAEYALRKRPLQNVTVTRTVWDARAYEVQEAARKLYRADGSSDILKLMASLRATMADLESAVSPTTTKEN